MLKGYTLVAQATMGDDTKGGKTATKGPFFGSVKWGLASSFWRSECRQPGTVRGNRLAIPLRRPWPWRAALLSGFCPTSCFFKEEKRNLSFIHFIFNLRKHKIFHGNWTVAISKQCIFYFFFLSIPRGSKIILVPCSCPLFSPRLFRIWLCRKQPV